MTPKTLYSNQEISLNRDTPVLLSVTPSRNVSILFEEVSACRGWNHHECRPWPPPHQNDTVHSMLSVWPSYDCVSMCTKKDYQLLCHLLGSNNIHKHRILRLHLAQILVHRILKKKCKSHRTECTGAWKILHQIMNTLCSFVRIASSIPLMDLEQYVSSSSSLYDLQPTIGSLLSIQPLL